MTVQTLNGAIKKKRRPTYIATDYNEIQPGYDD